MEKYSLMKEDGGHKERETASPMEHQERFSKYF